MIENNKYIAPDVEVLVIDGADVITSSRWDLPEIGFGSYSNSDATDVGGDW